MSEPTGAWRDSSNWRSRNDPGRNDFKPNRDRDGTTSSWRSRDTDRGARAPVGNNGRSRLDDWGYERRTRPSDRIKTLGSSQGDEEASANAISEGRRIYVGNLRYQAKPEDIEDLLKKNELGHFDKIHISIDPFTGRNPSYCFVEFPDRESADRAMATLEGKELLGREIKCRPCQPKGGHSRGREFNEGLNRWGNWSGEDRRGGKQGGGQYHRSSSPAGTPESFSRYRQDFTGKRLCVAGLPRMTDQATNFEEISGLFKDFKVEAISKRISAHEKWRGVPGNHDYCFVDFATPQQAQEACEAVDGTQFRGAPLKVSFAKGRSQKWQERDELAREG